VASRVATELILEVRYMLRSLGVALDGPALMLDDNTSVVLNTTVPSSVLKKEHNALKRRLKTKESKRTHNDLIELVIRELYMGLKYIPNHAI
jgi:hypothetical protein